MMDYEITILLACYEGNDMQQKQNLLPLFDSWAHMHLEEQPRAQIQLLRKQPSPVEQFTNDPRIEQQKSEAPYAVKARAVLEFSLHISKRPGRTIPMYSPTGRLVGNGYFKGYPLLRFTPKEIFRVLCLLWRIPQ
jgi:hypothetical protein